jgi:Uma2 family endonuclease
MAASVLWSERDDRPTEDHIVRFHEATWADYEHLLAMRGDKSAPRIAFLEGEIEIMSPSRQHESIKSRIGRLVETWCLERGVEFSTYGSWTVGDKRVERAAEPDECYVFGQVAAPQRPDLAIEVVWTSGGINKLEIYRKLGVREVWFWQKGLITLYGLRGEQYEAIPRSEALPALDLQELATFLDRPTTSQSIRDYRAALQAGGSGRPA